MKLTFTQLLAVLFVAGLWQGANAQTLTTNPENWSTMFPTSPFSCTSCTITIPTGYTLNLDVAGTCDGCTFTGGGTVKVAAGFKFPNNTTTFNNLTVIINSAPSIKNLNFSNDSIAVNAALTYSSGPTSITNSRISVNAAVKFQTATLDGDSIHLNSTMSFSSSTDAITNSHVDMADGSKLSMQNATTSNSVFSLAGTAAFSSNNLTSSADSFYMAGSSTVKNSSSGSFTNDVFSLSGTSGFSNSSGMTVSGGSISTYDNSTFKASSSFTSTGTDMSFNDNSAFSASSSLSVTGGDVTLNGNASLKSSSAADFEGAVVSMNGNTTLTVSSTLTLGSGSDLTVGDGSGTSTAKVTTSGLAVTDNSFLGVASGSNSVKVSSGKFTNDSGVHTIGSGAITGCNTFNNSGSNTCVVLAVADISLTAIHSDDDKISLSWTDNQTTTADQYLLQRNTGGLDWTIVTTVSAGNNANEVYRFTDNNAPAGTIDYRIARVDKNGKTSYSTVSAVTVTVAVTGAHVGIYPNPAIGGTFYVTTSNMGHLIINVYTLTGQLLVRTEGNGQTQYAVHLPSQAMGSGAVVVQTIVQDVTKTFTVLVR